MGASEPSVRSLQSSGKQVGQKRTRSKEPTHVVNPQVDIVIEEELSDMGKLI